MPDGLQRRWCSRCFSISKMPSLDSLHRRFQKSDCKLSVGPASGTKEISGGPHFLCPRYTDSISHAGKTGLKEVMVGLAAVFDGHNGAEASEMASKLLLEYFLLHTYFLLDGAYSTSLKNLPGRLPFKGVSDTIFPVFNQDEEIEQHRLDSGRCKFIFPEIFDGSFHMEILKESLLRTIHDIDAKFSKEAFRSNLQSGSTATVVVLVDGQILVSNIGDSKAFICSEKFQSPLEAKGTLSRLYRKKRRDGVIVAIKDYDNFKSIASNGLTHFYVKELTRDHHPDRDDERARVEAAGGYVVDWGGVPRVNGELAVSRAIGDIFYKSYGVISSPEVTDWQPLIANDSYVVVASDGIFEKLSTQDVCDLLWGAHQQGNEKLELFSSCQYSLADCIVNTAFEKGSMDNLAVVVVPLRLIVNERYDVERSIDSLNFGMQHTESAYITGSALVPMENVRQVMANFNRLLVKGKQARIGCFYLSENLNEDMDLTFKSQESDLHDLAKALPEDFVHPYSGSLNLYNDKSLCFHFGMDVGEDKGQCINPEGFNRLLAVLESIPFHDSGASTSDSFEFLVRDLRYVLHRRFGRGSYGEVWLAFRWNCSQDSDTSNWSPKNMNCSNCNSHLHPYDRYMSSHTNSSTHDCHAGCRGNISFILKRIMVEKGATVYLSGLREKYFGEVFLNASISLGGLSSTESSNFFSEVPQYDSYDTPETNTSVLVDTELVWSPENMFLNKFRLKREVYEEGLNHVARYVESFESQSKEIWLVFHNEGISLSKLMYTAEVENVADAERAEKGKTIHVLHPSKWWHWLRTSDTGKEEMRNLIWQLLMALKSCHDRNITHRDIKPENLVICFEDKSTGRCLNGRPSEDNNYHIKMRIIDFGSAIDEFSMKHLYGSNGPSRSEQTFEYTPPEALLNATWFRTPPSISSKYDMWSVGVVILELILGSPHVFQINARTQALLDPHLEGWNEDTKELVYKLRSFMEMCILIPGSSSRHCCSKAKRDPDAVWPASWKCSEESFSYQIKSRDPIKLGFPNVWALRLVRQLLLWDPEDRLSVDDALQHPYFRIPPMSCSSSSI